MVDHVRDSTTPAQRLAAQLVPPDCPPPLGLVQVAVPALADHALYLAVVLWAVRSCSCLD